MYRRTFDNSTLKNFRIVDLRSDTISVPTDAMKKAMFEAEVGDDVYGEDPTVLALELRSAKLFEKESALFLPSGTMCNLLSIMVHCSQRGSEVIIGHMAHGFAYEQGGAASIAGVSTNKIHNNDDGTFSLDEVKQNIRGTDIHEPITQLVMVEQTHNMAGGKVVPLDWIEDLSKICKEHDIKIHMDGARIFNAAEYLKLPVSRLVRDVDSVCFCLSKGLACPVGSILLGTTKFIDQARRLRKALGGGMRQAGFLAAAGLCALDTIVPTLGVDHDNTRQLAEGIYGLKSSVFKVDLETLHTNILMIKVNDPNNKITALDLSNRLAEVKDDEVANGVCDEAQKPIMIKSSCKNLSTLRVVIYTQITTELIQLAIKKVCYVMRELDNSL
ncbi:unnamed protein product [Diamesa hyperborea]